MTDTTDCDKTLSDAVKRLVIEVGSHAELETSVVRQQHIGQWFNHRVVVTIEPTGEGIFFVSAQKLSQPCMTGDEMRARLKALCHNQRSWAQWMVSMGDHRALETVERSIRRMISGKSRVSAEMIVLLNVASQAQQISVVTGPSDAQ